VEAKDPKGVARGITYREFTQGSYQNYIPAGEREHMYSPIPGYQNIQRPHYGRGFSTPNYFYYPNTVYTQYTKTTPTAEEKPEPPNVITNKSVIKTDVVVNPVMQQKKATQSEQIQKEEEKKEEKKDAKKEEKKQEKKEEKNEEKKEERKEAQKEVKKEVKEVKEKKKEGKKDNKSDTPKKKKNVEVKHVKDIETVKDTPKIETASKEDTIRKVKDDVVKEKAIQKSEAAGIVESKQEDSDLSKLKNILSKVGSTTKRAFTYELIIQIGREIKICKQKPILLAKDIFSRRTELNEVQVGSPINKRSKGFERKAETEEVKKLKIDAKNQLERVTEEAKIEDIEGDIKLALNKLTPDNYQKIFKIIYELKSKSEKTQEAFVDLVYKRAKSEQKYIEIYGNLCKDIVCKELNIDPKKTLSESTTLKSSSGAAIILKVKSAFAKRNEFKEEIKASKQDLTQEEVDNYNRDAIFGSTV